MRREIKRRIHTSVRTFFSKGEAEGGARQEFAPAFDYQQPEAELGDARGEVGAGEHDTEF